MVSSQKKMGLLFGVILGFSGCEKEFQMVRTASSGTTVSSAAVPISVYGSECSSHEEYGPSSSCGSSYSCEWSTSHCLPGAGSCEAVQSCGYSYDSCLHTVTNCYDVFSHTSQAKLTLQFDKK